MSLNCLIKTIAHTTTHADTKKEKERTIVLAVKTKKFKEYH
jgi:hypothetical protein